MFQKCSWTERIWAIAARLTERWNENADEQLVSTPRPFNMIARLLLACLLHISGPYISRIGRAVLVAFAATINKQGTLHSFVVRFEWIVTDVFDVEQRRSYSRPCVSLRFIAVASLRLAASEFICRVKIIIKLNASLSYTLRIGRTVSCRRITIRKNQMEANETPNTNIIRQPNESA